MSKLAKNQPNKPQGHMGGGKKWAKSNVRDLKHEKVSSYSKSRTCHVNVRVTPDNLNTPNNKSVEF